MNDAPPGPIDQMRILRLTFNEALAAISVSLIFFGLISAQFKLLSAVARSKAVVTGAALSYAIYLVHWPIIDGVSVLLHRPHGLAALLKVGSLSITIVIPVAYVLHRAIERPLLNLKDTLREPQKPSALLTRADPLNPRPVQEVNT